MGGSAVGGICFGGCLLWGGVCCGGCLFLGGLLPGDVCSRGSALGGVCSWGVCIPACIEANTPPPLLTESQMPVKTLPWPNFVAAGNNGCSF